MSPQEEPRTRLVVALRVNARASVQDAGQVLVATTALQSHGQLAEANGFAKNEVSFGLQRMYWDRVSNELLTPEAASERIGVPWDGHGDSHRQLSKVRFVVRDAPPDHPIYTRGFVIGGRFPGRRS
jgi:hypothetical protein